MSRKRFATMIAVVLLMGGAGLLCLYMTLGKMSQALRQQGRIGGANAAESSEGPETIKQMTLTPVGESQLREEEQRILKEQADQKSGKAPATGDGAGTAPASPAGTTGEGAPARPATTPASKSPGEPPASSKTPAPGGSGT